VQRVAENTFFELNFQPRLREEGVLPLIQQFDRSFRDKVEGKIVIAFATLQINDFRRGEKSVWGGMQGCQMVYFQTKNPNLGKFLRALDWKMFIYFLDNLEYLTDIRVRL
jgi:hypothetical protein